MSSGLSGATMHINLWKYTTLHIKISKETLKKKKKKTKAEFGHWKYRIRYTEIEFILNNKDVKSLLGTKLPTKTTHEQNGNREAPESPSREPGDIAVTLRVWRSQGSKQGQRCSQPVLPCSATLLSFPLPEVSLYTSAPLPSMVLACAEHGHAEGREMEEIRTEVEGSAGVSVPQWRHPNTILTTKGTDSRYAEKVPNLYRLQKSVK